MSFDEWIDNSIDIDGADGVYEVGNPDLFHAVDYYDNREWVGSTLRNNADGVDLYTSDLSVRTSVTIASFIAVRAQGGTVVVGANGHVKFSGFVRQDGDELVHIQDHATAKQTTRPWGKDLDEWIEEDPLVIDKQPGWGEDQKKFN